MNPAIHLRRTGVQGWKQFLTARKGMLDEYDRARTHSGAHEVATHHGNVAEDAFRDWLQEFLPKRFAATPGYVVSHAQPDTAKLPHFDVIIYDQLACPVLWLEGGGKSRSRAIPAEHVSAVIEVKSAISGSASKDALKHLCDLNPLLHLDDPTERYPKWLPPQFFSAIVFFEARKDDEYAAAALDNLVPATYPRGYFGAFILRGEGLPDDVSAQVRVLEGAEPMASLVGRSAESIVTGTPFSNSKPQADGKHLGVHVMWSQAAFAMFAFDVVALLNGTFRTGYVSSFHGMNHGTSRSVNSASE